jgi:hypothetical protein
VLGDKTGKSNVAQATPTLIVTEAASAILSEVRAEQPQNSISFLTVKTMQLSLNASGSRSLRT